MTLVHLLRQAIRVVGKTPLAWLCSTLLVVNDYLFGSILPPLVEETFLNLVFTLLLQYIIVVTQVGLIIIGSEPPLHERLTVRRLFLPDGQVFWRFVAMMVLLLFVSLPAYIPMAINNTSRQLAQVGSEITLSPISPIWTIPLAILVAPFVITLELAQRDVVLNCRSVTSAIKHAWPITRHNLFLLIAVFGLGYLARYGASSLSPPISHLLLIPVIPLSSVLATRAFVYLEREARDLRHESTTKQLAGDD